MFRANYQKLTNKYKGAHGGIANESRFAEPEIIRTYKRFTIPALNCGGICIMEQAWNEASSKKDVIKIKLEQGDAEIVMYFNRQDFEQMIFSMAQNDETLKYIRTEARAQRNY